LRTVEVVAPNEGIQLTAWGEVAWVQDGRVVRTSGMGYHPECFEPYTCQLLASAPDAQPSAVHVGEK
jgi:hypothetical protein